MAEYKQSFVVKFLHELPHLDLTFRPVNSTFAPDNLSYRESLIFWVSLPILWLLVTLLIFLVYFCYRCCQKDLEKDDDKPCIRWFIVILAFIACCIVGVGVYGNETMRKGLMRVSDSIADSNDHLVHVRENIKVLRNQTYETRDFARSVAEGRLSSEVRSGAQTKASIDSLTDRALTFMMTLEGQLVKLQHKDKADALRIYSFYWWISVSVLLAWFLCHNMLLMCGVCTRSKCTLLIFCTLGIFTLVLTWTGAGVLLGASVATGDFCNDTNRYIEKESSSSFGENRALFLYYIHCNKTGDFFTKQFDEVNSLLTSAYNPILTALSTQQDADFIGDRHALTTLSGHLVSLRDQAGRTQSQLLCTSFQDDYTDAVNGFCDITLCGLVTLFSSLVVFGILFTILVIVASKAWSQFSEKGMGDGEEEEMFLPRADNPASHYGYRGMGGTRGNPRDHLMMHHRSTPPPAYNGVEFYRTYADTTHSSDDQRSDMI